MLNRADIIQDIANFNLSLFGIGITLLTVLISFVLSKKDEVKVYSDLYKTSHIDLSLKGKIQYSIQYIRYLRKIIIHIALISLLSICSYLLYWIDQFVSTDWIIYAMISIAVPSFIYAIVLITCIMIFFWKYTKPN